MYAMRFPALRLVISSDVGDPGRSLQKVEYEHFCSGLPEKGEFYCADTELGRPSRTECVFKRVGLLSGVVVGPGRNRAG